MRSQFVSLLDKLTLKRHCPFIEISSPPRWRIEARCYSGGSHWLRKYDIVANGTSIKPMSNNRRCRRHNRSRCRRRDRSIWIHLQELCLLRLLLVWLDWIAPLILVREWLRFREITCWWWVFLRSWRMWVWCAISSSPCLLRHVQMHRLLLQFHLFRDSVLHVHFIFQFNWINRTALLVLTL